VSDQLVFLQQQLLLPGAVEQANISSQRTC